MDGDDLGQWVSGAKTPPLLKVLAGAEADENSPKGYFKKHWQPAKAGGLRADAVHRPLTPGFHAALSEALGNFSLYCAAQVVGQFDGQLLYSGGDDVLAMVQAEKALDCAFALQCAFRGELPADAPHGVRLVLEDLFEFYPDSPGFIRCKHSAGKQEHLRPSWPLMVMGPCATASVGIAVGHVRSPMQDTIQAARDAERAAKSVPGKGAFCISILKRSGESAQFAAKWDSSVAGVWAELTSGVLDQTGRFAYRYLQLIRPLLASTAADNDRGWEKLWTPGLINAVQAELRHVLKQQASQEPGHAASNAHRWIGALVGENLNQPALTPHDFIHFWMAWAFVNRLQDQP
jgi:CRISPR/Cas system-associated protein Cas10 (large subunit of type III CRISPR-Cas system)